MHLEPGNKRLRERALGLRQVQAIRTQQPLLGHLPGCRRHRLPLQAAGLR